MATQTLQSGQRSHHLLFNYERDNFCFTMIRMNNIQVKVLLYGANNGFFIANTLGSDLKPYFQAC